jgi:integrase
VERSRRRRYWSPAVESAKVAPFRPHDLRQTAVALWIASGANALEVARRAEHTKVSFTLDRYGHLFPEADAGVADRLEELIAAKPKERAAKVAQTRRRS